MISETENTKYYKAMKVIGNIIWMVFGGFLASLEYILAGIALCLTVVGIPFGLQCFKLAIFVLWPFGTEAVKTEKSAGTGCLITLMNVIWFFVGAIPLIVTHFILGVLFGITIIGIPFAKQHFKLMGMSLTPFGRELRHT